VRLSSQVPDPEEARPRQACHLVGSSRVTMCKWKLSAPEALDPIAEELRHRGYSAPGPPPLAACLPYEGSRKRTRGKTGTPVKVASDAPRHGLRPGRREKRRVKPPPTTATTLTKIPSTAATRGRRPARRGASSATSAAEERYHNLR
jgi:hypothetical protein